MVMPSRSVLLILTKFVFQGLLSFVAGTASAGLRNKGAAPSAPPPMFFFYQPAAIRRHASSGGLINNQLSFQTAFVISQPLPSIRPVVVAL